MSHRRFRKMAGEVLAAVDELGLIDDRLEQTCGTLAETQALERTAAFGAQRCGCWCRLGSHGHRHLLADRAHALNPAELFGGLLGFKLHRSPRPHDTNSADLFGGIRSAELKVEVISPVFSLKPNHPLDKPAGFSDSRAAVDICVRIIRS